jgi:hypothetical protein
MIPLIMSLICMFFQIVYAIAGNIDYSNLYFIIGQIWAATNCIKSYIKNDT